MYYETFLFTRNKQRDFTAFIRPNELTNKDISIIASAVNYVNDISDLTTEWPALYCFPIGQYVMLLRHYDSGRKHAGRSIANLEGIAVKRTFARRFALAMPHFLAHQGELLAVASQLPDVENLMIEEAPQREWPEVQADAAVEGTADDSLVNEFVARLELDRLYIPFTLDGRAMLITALSDSRFPSLYFAFGTNSDVLAQLNRASIDVDIVSYFNTAAPSLRSRATNEITSELTDYTSRPPSRPPSHRPATTPETAADPSLLTPREAKAQLEARRPADDPLAQYDASDGAVLTPREIVRRARQQEQTVPEKTETLFHWLGDLIMRLLRRK